MPINLEQGKYTIPGKGLGISMIQGSEGWYGVPKGEPEDHILEWHMGRAWQALKGSVAGLPAVIERCQGERAWKEGKGAGTTVWHGPFPYPYAKDYPEGTICRECWGKQQAEMN